MIRNLARRDVRTATQTFLSRHNRKVASSENNDPDLTTIFPDPGEGQADEAVRSLLSDARRAMAERRQADFKTSLTDIRELITDAMNELESRGYRWGLPGTQPEWPPLRELASTLRDFREEIIRQGTREYCFELLQFDLWLRYTGSQRNCGELFSSGLDGYRQNHQISNRIDNTDFRTILLENPWSYAEMLTYSGGAEKTLPFILETMSNQERMLSDALDAQNVASFVNLHQGFEKWLRHIQRYWGIGSRLPPELAKQYQKMESDYRIILMGLAGRAALLEKSSRIADMGPYAAAARRIYTRLEILANDLAEALRREHRMGSSLWSQWAWEGETDDTEDGRARFIFPDGYPLTFFSMRFMELATDPMPTVNMHGNAKKVLDWLTENLEGIERLVSPTPNLTMEPLDSINQPRTNLTVEQRRELVMGALNAAIGDDQVNEDLEIVERDLSKDRVSDFASTVRATASSSNPLELLFERAGTRIHIPTNGDEVPEERGFRVLEPKVLLTDTPEGARTSYPSLEGDEWGRALSDDVIHLLCEALSGAALIATPVDTPDEFMQALDKVLEPVYNLFRISVAKARTTICRLVLSFRSQFFQSRRHFSSQAKDRSTTHLFGSTTKVCSSLRFTTSTAAPNRLRTPAAKGFPV